MTMPSTTNIQDQTEIIALTKELLRVAEEALMLRSIESNILANPKLDEDDRQWYRDEGYRIESAIRAVIKRGEKFDANL